MFFLQYFFKCKIELKKQQKTKRVILKQKQKKTKKDNFLLNT